jgi:hypothetical protein
MAAFRKHEALEFRRRVIVGNMRAISSATSMAMLRSVTPPDR